MQMAKASADWLCGNAQRSLCKKKMSGGADWKIFGESLNDAEDEGLPPIHKDFDESGCPAERLSFAQR